LSYDDHIKPQEFIGPKYTPPQLAHSKIPQVQSQSQSKNHAKSTLRWGSREALTQSKTVGKYKPYDEYTKVFDKSELKTKLRERY